MKKRYRGRLIGHYCYMQHARTLRAVVESVDRNALALRTIFGKILSDEHFVTLLRAESMTTMPTYLKSLLEGKRRVADEIN